MKTDLNIKIKDKLNELINTYYYLILISSFISMIISTIYVLIVVIFWACGNGIVFGFLFLSNIENTPCELNFYSLPINFLFVLCLIISFLSSVVFCKIKNKSEKKEINGNTNIIKIMNEELD